MNGGFKQNRYGTKWEEIQEAAKEDARKPRTAKEIQDLVASPRYELVKDPVLRSPDVEGR